MLIMGGKVHSMITGINFIYELFSIRLFITYFNDPSHYLYIEYLFGFDKISSFKVNPNEVYTLRPSSCQNCWNYQNFLCQCSGCGISQIHVELLIIE